MAVAQITLFDEIAEFFTSSPTLEQITQYYLSEGADERISYLLELNRNGKLSEGEAQELDQYLVIESLMQRVKIRASQKLKRG
jgi:hypothetical protein